MNIRFRKIEELLKCSINYERKNLKKIEPKEKNNIIIPENDIVLSNSVMDKAPGLTTTRIITYGDKVVEIPLFLRDDFLLLQ